MTKLFARIASGAAVVAAGAGLVYTVTFALYVQKGYRWALWASTVTLLVGSLAVLLVSVGAYRRFGAGEPDLALVAFVLGLAGALGAMLHSVYDLANLAKEVPGGNKLPFPVDPRGLATFALTGLALGLFGWLGVRDKVLPRGVQWLALGTAVCLLVVFLGRLIVLDPKSSAVKPFAILGGLVLAPATYLAFARSFMHAARPTVLGPRRPRTHRSPSRPLATSTN